ncbi:MAG: HAD family hydrolase [Eubacteriales bacterium]|nr:HAD family hydrolase [Eubacteriales bacterium]
MIKLIASDLDGTILQNGAQEISEEMFSLIRQLREKGILFAAASGRQYANMRRLFAPVFEDMAFVCENGAVTFYQGELLYQDVFDRGLMRDILKEAYEKEGTEFSCSTKDFYYMKPKSEHYIRLMTEVVDCEYKVIQSLDEIREPCIKVAVYEEGGITEESRLYWQERFQDRCRVVTSGFAWLDFIPFHTNKARGVKKLLDMNRIAPEECLVFGDEYNDIEMLEAVKYSFAMKNAKPGVKAAASYETESVEEILKKLLMAGGNIEEIL